MDRTRIVRRWRRNMDVADDAEYVEMLATLASSTTRCGDRAGSTLIAMVSPCCWCARPIRGPDRLTDIDSRRDGKSSRCRHSIAGHVATAQRCGQQAESQPQVCSMNTFPSQRDCCFVSTSALFGLDTNALPLQRKLKLSARNPCRPCPRHPLKRRYVAPWRLGQPPPATPAAHAQRSAIVGTGRAAKPASHSH